MEEIINKLIEADKNARQRVSQAKAGRAAAVEKIEETKKQLSLDNEKKFTEALKNEKEKQIDFLSKAEKQIEEKYLKTVSDLEAIYNEKCDEWVDQIVQSVIG